MSGQRTPGDWVSFAQYNETKLTDELNLTNSRLTWVLGTEMFLLAAYAFVSGPTPPSLSRVIADSRAFLELGIPILGYVTVLAGSASIFAAQKVVLVLEHQRHFFDNKLNDMFGAHLHCLGHLRDDDLEDTRRMGSAPLLVIPLAFAILWGLAVAIALPPAWGVGAVLVGIPIWWAGTMLRTLRRMDCALAKKVGYFDVEPAGGTGG